MPCICSVYSSPDPLFSWCVSVPLARQTWSRSAMASRMLQVRYRSNCDNKLFTKIHNLAYKEKIVESSMWLHVHVDNCSYIKILVLPIYYFGHERWKRWSRGYKFWSSSFFKVIYKVKCSNFSIRGNLLWKLNPRSYLKHFVNVSSSAALCEKHRVWSRIFEYCYIR